MNTTLAVLGVVALVAAIAGTGVKLAGNEVPSIPSLRRQILLGLVGVAVLIVGLGGNPFDPKPISNTTPPTSPVPPGDPSPQTTSSTTLPPTSSSTTTSTRRVPTPSPTPNTSPSTAPTTSTTARPVSCTVFDTDPLIVLSRSGAPRGATVTVTATGFCPSDIVDIRVHLSHAGSPTTDARGGFVYTITVPADAPPPVFSTSIVANSRSHRGNASAPFTIER